MKKMCFGTFATILSRCKASVTNQKNLIGSMLLSVNYRGGGFYGKYRLRYYL